MADFLSQRMARFASNIEAARKDARVSKYMRVCDSADAEKDARGLRTIAEKGVQAGILMNFKRMVCDSVDAPTSRGEQISTMSDFGPFIPEVFPVVTAWYPDFPLRDLISVQDMDQDLAYLLFSKLVTGTNKAPTIVGQAVETATGMRQINGFYPSGEIIGETIPTEQLQFESSGNLIVGAAAYFPLKTAGDYFNKYKLVVAGSTGADGEYTSLSQVGNKIILQKNGAGTDSGSYMDIETGGIFIAGGTALGNAVITANYVWDLDYAVDENIPKVKEQIERIEMRAEPRVLAMQWTIFAEALKKSQFQTDFRSDNTKRVLDLLYQYQVRYILDTMWTFGTGTAAPVVIPSGNMYSLDVQAAQVSRQLKQIATQIELASGRMEGNRIVVGKNMKSWLESLPSNWFKPVAQPSGFSAPREIGTFGTWKVYYDQQAADDAAFMTYKGSEWFDAALYMGMFLPMVPTDAIGINVTVRQSFAEMVAYKFHKPNCVVKFTVNFA